MFRESDYEFDSCLEEGSCDEEEEYEPISEGAEESVKTPKLEREYNTPGESLEVRSRTSSLERVVNTGTSSDSTSAQGIPPSLDYPLDILNTKSMAGEDIRLPTFNGNGVEDLEKHRFLCEAVWTIHQVQNEDIRKAQMIMTLQGRALDWFMNFFIVPQGDT